MFTIKPVNRNIVTKKIKVEIADNPTNAQKEDKLKVIKIEIIKEIRILLIQYDFFIQFTDSSDISIYPLIIKSVRSA